MDLSRLAQSQVVWEEGAAQSGLTSMGELPCHRSSITHKRLCRAHFVELTCLVGTEGNKAAPFLDLWARLTHMHNQKHSAAHLCRLESLEPTLLVGTEGNRPPHQCPQRLWACLVHMHITSHSAGTSACAGWSRTSLPSWC